jgi:predicted Zn-dependent protease with MMP-like domain
MDRKRFEELVARAVENLPEEFSSRMENVDVIVADEPTYDQRGNLPGNRVLLGLYEGVPITRRGQGYGMVLPDKITIFQKAIEANYRGEKNIINEIRRVVLHEIAHHFGISDARLKELGMG